jgi:hypothetical protein
MFGGSLLANVWLKDVSLLTIASVWKKKTMKTKVLSKQQSRHICQNKQEHNLMT